MKFIRVIATIALVVALTATTAFAALNTVSSNATALQQENDNLKKDGKHCKEKRFKCKYGDFTEKDPIKALQRKKEKVQSMLKTGEITKEKADKITANIDAKIKEIEKFNSLSVKQKKEKLIKDFKTHLDQKVKDKKITEDKAKELLKDYTDKVNKWDGKGCPMFGKRGKRNKCRFN